MKAVLTCSPNGMFYVWGDPAKEISVLCDGKIIVVTQNL
jgi:hypothetical protein